MPFVLSVLVVLAFVLLDCFGYLRLPLREDLLVGYWLTAFQVRYVGQLVLRDQFPQSDNVVPRVCSAVLWLLVHSSLCMLYRCDSVDGVPQPL